ncbi:MAG: GMC family oxidoreductase [Bacteroidales bacterium]|nr:GMC family oxidoreductase [Bacteroidales bacterium]
MANKQVNAVIIGAGAGGGIVAKELATAGLLVVLLERGKWQTYNDHDNDELISQRTSALKCPFGPDNEKYRRVVPDGKGGWRIVLPNDWAYGNNAGCVGGGTLSYGAMAWRFMPEDFAMKTTYGTVEGSTLVDWPLSYDDLEPFYEKAEYEIGVSGDHTLNPFAPPQNKHYPMPPFPYNREGKMLEPAARKLGLHPFPIPMLRNSVFYNGRPPCIHMRTCIGYACPVNAKAGSQNTVIPVALKTGNCQVKSECKVSEIIVDEKGRARGINYFDQQDNPKTQAADLVVVCASATETARLLLNSKSVLFPDGAGNNNGWVGHNLQDHAYCGAVGLFEEEVYDDAGPGACIAVNDFNHHNAEIVGGGLLANEFIRQPYLFSGIRPPGNARWGKEHKDFQREYFKKHISVVGPIQEMPVFENQVAIDPSVRDYWGIPVLRVSGFRHPKDFEGCNFLASKAEQWLKETGAHTTWKVIPGQRAGAGQHQAGTCRMGNDPKTSVTNRYGQLHEIDNLFIADGSLHVTNGGFNPALTIMALSYWVSDFIKKEWKGTRFK